MTAFVLQGHIYDENVLHRKDSADKTAFNWSTFSSRFSQRRGQMCVSVSAFPHWKQTSRWPAWLMSRASRWASASPRLSSSTARADGSLTRLANVKSLPLSLSFPETLLIYRSGWRLADERHKWPKLERAKGVSGKSQRVCSMCQSPFTPNDEEHWCNWSVRQPSNARTQATTCVQIQL